jgi:hypothetical protein
MLRNEIFRPFPRHTKLETVRGEPSNLFLIHPLGGSDTLSSLRINELSKHPTPEKVPSGLVSLENGI